MKLTNLIILFFMINAGNSNLLAFINPITIHNHSVRIKGFVCQKPFSCRVNSLPLRSNVRMGFEGISDDCWNELDDLNFKGIENSNDTRLIGVNWDLSKQKKVLEKHGINLTDLVELARTPKLQLGVYVSPSYPEQVRIIGFSDNGVLTTVVSEERVNDTGVRCIHLVTAWITTATEQNLLD